MNVAVSPPTVEVRRNHLIGLVGAAVTLGAASAWALGIAIETGSAPRLSTVEASTRDVSSAEAVLAPLGADARAYVEAIMAMTDAELGAAFGAPARP